MCTTRWETVIARVTRNDPANLDDLLRPLDGRSADPGRDLFPEAVGLIPFAPEFREPDTIAVGVRVQEPRSDAADLAVQLGTFAAERNVEVVVLSHIDYSGLERFGFRTERIAGDDPAARTACERQVATFWNLEVII